MESPFPVLDPISMAAPVPYGGEYVNLGLSRVAIPEAGQATYRMLLRLGYESTTCGSPTVPGLLKWYINSPV